MKRRNLLHTGIAAVLLLSTGACEDFKFGNAFLDKPFTTDSILLDIMLPDGSGLDLLEKLNHISSILS